MPLPTLAPPHKAVSHAIGLTILGIDPGVESLGWGVATVGPDGRLYHTAHGCLKTLSIQSMPDRVDALARDINTLITTRHPGVIAMEAYLPYHGARQGAGGNTMRVLGAVRALGVAHGIKVVEYSAQALKGILGCDRNADKKPVQAAVQKFFGLEKLPRPTHAADALAATIAYYRRGGDGHSVIASSKTGITLGVA